MIETNSLDAEKFHLVPSGDPKGVFEAEARHPDTGNLLGYIRYEEKAGKLELVNFGAGLPLSSLDVGYTTKMHNPKLAGCHGEGFKIAALVMLREGYAVHIEASNHYWNFHWGGSDRNQLYCGISAPQDHVLETQRNEYNKMVQGACPRKKKAYICADVKFTIGVHFRNGKKISAKDFEEWIKIPLDLTPPDRIIHTSKGRLILDPDYSNRLYLKGLLLECARTSREYKFGYDLNNGDVNRDRQWMRDPGVVASNLTTIWEEAAEDDETTTMAAYIAMHQDTVKWADVDLAENYITQTFAQKIWQFLCMENSEGELFYHDSHQGDSVGALPGKHERRMLRADEKSGCRNHPQKLKEEAKTTLAVSLDFIA